MVVGPTTRVTLTSGQDVTCTVTNAAQPAALTLIKSVNNQFGTNAAASAWNLAANGPGSNDFNGNGTASQGNLPAGDYVLSESGPAGWTASAWSCPGATVDDNTVSLGIGDDVTCTITNTPNHPHLTLVKNLQLAQGANETEADFTLIADGPTLISVPGANAANAVAKDAFVGTYTLSETGPAGYTQVGGWVCVGGDQNGNQITLGVADDAVCTVTNASDPAQVTLVKEVNNNHGGDLGPADFQLTLNGSNVDQGANAVVPNTVYTVSELDVDGYSQVGDVVCTDDDTDATVVHPFSLE